MNMKKLGILKSMNLHGMSWRRRLGSYDYTIITLSAYMRVISANVDCFFLQFAESSRKQHDHFFDKLR